MYGANMKIGFYRAYNLVIKLQSEHAAITTTLSMSTDTIQSLLKIPDDGLCKPKHVGANIIVFNVLRVFKN